MTTAPGVAPRQGPQLVAVFVGGVIGTALRLSVDALIPHADAGFPFSTLIINVFGSFALGVLTARVWPVAPAWVRAGLGPGLLGGFTTFSAVMVSILSMSEAEDVAGAALYLALTLVAGFLAALAGLRVVGSATPEANG